VNLLITGFGSFLRHEDNPSARLARALDGRRAGPYRLVALAPLPVRYGEAAERALRRARELSAVGILSFGLAAKIEVPQVEGCGRNLARSASPDIAGEVRAGKHAVPGAPARLLASFPRAPLLASLSAAGVGARRSEDAGGYVCNDLLYRLLHAAPSLRSRPMVGFVHIPNLRRGPKIERLAAALGQGLGQVGRAHLLDR
jgi:pyroglutamyl-peptidase